MNLPNLPIANVKKKVIAILLFLVFVMVVSVCWTLLSKPQNIILQTTNISSNVHSVRLQIQALLKIYSEDKVYQKVITAFQNNNYREQHLALHLFGEELYKKDGVKGAIFCDSTYSYACFHGLFIYAVSEKGLSVIPELDRACHANPKFDIECQHGIGHGILSFLGRSKFAEASKICGTLSEKSAFSCRDGVLMEYHFETEVKEDDVRYVTQPYYPDPYDPCMKLPPQEQPACFGNLPEWWFSNGKEITPKKAGELCNAVQTRSNKISCLISVGYYIPPFYFYDAQKSIEACTLMPTLESKEICKTFGYQSFIRKGFLNKAEMMCVSAQGTPNSCADRKKFYKEIGLNYD